MHTAQSVTPRLRAYQKMAGISAPAITTISQAGRKGKAEIAGSEPAAV